jgi:hypothetical protein
METLFAPVATLAVARLAHSHADAGTFDGDALG